MVGFFLAMISGALMSIQGVFNTGVTKQTGVWLASGFVSLTGFIVCVIMWFIKERQQVAPLEILKVDNKYMLLGGVIGAFITFTVIKSMENLGPAKAVLIIVISQVLVAYLIELFGMFKVDKVGFSISKLVGILVAITGLVIFKWKS